MSVFEQTFPTASGPNPQGWYFTWFGWITKEENDHIYHDKLGWIYVYSHSTPDNFLFYHYDSGKIMWTNLYIWGPMVFWVSIDGEDYSYHRNAQYSWVGQFKAWNYDFTACIENIQGD
jgi:hypothetical protein